MSDSYHDDYQTISRTMLCRFMQSRVEFEHIYIKRTMPPMKPTRQMLAGTVLHAILLEDKTLDELVLPYPDECLKSDGSLNGKPAARFREANPDAVCMKASEFNGVANVVNAVLANDDLRNIAVGASSREKRYDAEIEDMPCRCKPDICAELDTYVCGYDLKFCEKVDPLSFRRTNKRLRLWAQDAHYSKILAKHFDKPVQFRFCCVEMKPPHRVMWYWFDPQSRERAFDAHSQALHDLADCYATGDWSDHWPNVQVLEPWDLEVQDVEPEVICE